MMELKDLANYGSFGAAIPGTRSLKKDEEEEKRRMEEQAAAEQAAAAQGMKKGGKVSSASKRADGVATRGKTRGRMV
jgi:hypothetical protein